MSLNGNRIGGQYPSKPLNTRDKALLWACFIGGFALVFGPLIIGVRWWVWG